METLRDTSKSFSTERVFWCHQCHLEFKFPRGIALVNCSDIIKLNSLLNLFHSKIFHSHKSSFVGPKCQGDFCEEIFGEDNDPRKFVPYTAVKKKK